mmetsp:Transcript_44529/g.133145  ORF Transcript_44529/g.133145 Transcript_44529/m.133145 type:complete len:227 (+) Transcript_44529:1942-2622(+)
MYGERRAGGLPGRRPDGDACGRLVPRGGLQCARVPDRGARVLQGGDAQDGCAPAGANHARRGHHARGAHGRRDWRHELAPWHDQQAGRPARRHEDCRRVGAARGDVPVCVAAARHDQGARAVLDEAGALRCRAAAHPGGDHRQDEGGGMSSHQHGSRCGRAAACRLTQRSVACFQGCSVVPARSWLETSRETPCDCVLTRRHALARGCLEDPGWCTHPRARRVFAT